MGYSLTFHALDWQVLQRAMRSGSPELARHVMAMPQPIGTVAPDRLRPAVDALLGGAVGQVAAARPTSWDVAVDVDVAIAHAFLAIVRAMGEQTAEIIHNSAAGRRFRDVFLDHRVSRLAANGDAELLIDRPLFGLTHAGYPSWGGLNASELRGGWSRLFEADLPVLPDSDEEEWLRTLAEGLAGAVQLKRDLVTLYF